MSDDWVVQFEMVGDEPGAVDYELFDRLIRELADWNPGFLHSVGRYALLVHLTASSALEAHWQAVGRWQDAVRVAGAPPWRVVRLEVLTAEEFERDYRLAEREEQFGFKRRGMDSSDKLADDLLREVFRDSVTDLPTAEAFRARLQLVLSRRERPATQQAVLVVGLEAPSASSQTMRQRKRDVMLVEAVETLTAITRPGDIVARVGPDALAVLLEDIHPVKVMVLADRALHALTGGGPASDRGPIAVSVGVAVSRPAYDADRLLASAMAAMELARMEGGGRCELFGEGTATRWPPAAGLRADS